MPYPVPTIRLSIQLRALDIDVLVFGVKVDVPYCRRLICSRRGKADRLEERRDDKVHILSWVREKTDGGEQGEGGHSAGVIVSGETSKGGVEAGGYVCAMLEFDDESTGGHGSTVVCSLCAESGAACVVWHVDGQKDRFVADVCEA